MFGRGRDLAALAVAMVLLFTSIAAAERSVSSDGKGASRFAGRRVDEGDKKPGPSAIIGGSPVSNGTYPFMVALIDKLLLGGGGDDTFQAQFCGGTLIAPDWVLTAAHCVVLDFADNSLFPTDELAVMIGFEDLLDPARVQVDVTEVIIHDAFDGNRDETVINDIALLRLAAPQPGPFMPLPTPADAARYATGTDTQVIGWGARAYDEGSDTASDFPIQLHEATMPVADLAACNTSYQTGAAVNVLDTHVCIGNLGAGGVDSCNGDSGGPVFVDDGEGLLQVGLASFGIGCALPDFPGVYTRVDAYNDWINRTIDNGFTDANFFPQFANGGDPVSLSSDLVLFNTSAADVNLQLDVIDLDGNLVDPTTVFGGAHGQAVIPARGSFSLASSGAGDLVQGSVVARSDGDLGGVLVFRIPGLGAAGVGSAPQVMEVIAPVRRDALIRTGLAIANADVGMLEVTLTLRDDQGNVVPNGVVEIMLAHGARDSRFVDEIFENADLTDFRGTVTVVSDSLKKFSAVALEFGNGPGDFTTLPVQVIRPVQAVRQ